MNAHLLGCILPLSSSLFCRKIWLFLYFIFSCTCLPQRIVWGGKKVKQKALYSSLYQLWKASCELQLNRHTLSSLKKAASDKTVLLGNKQSVGKCFFFLIITLKWVLYYSEDFLINCQNMNDCQHSTSSAACSFCFWRYEIAVGGTALALVKAELQLKLGNLLSRSLLCCDASPRDRICHTQQW